MIIIIDGIKDKVINLFEARYPQNKINHLEVLFNLEMIPLKIRIVLLILIIIKKILIFILF